MTLALIAVVILGLSALVCYFLGAIRSLVILFGLFIGTLFALPLAPNLAALVGVKDRIGLWIFQPIMAIAFCALVALVAFGLAFLVHWKVAQYYRFNVDQVQRLRWDRLNQRLGACVGLIIGGLQLVVLCVFVYVAGYLTVQVFSDEGSSFLVRTISQARRDLAATGFDRMVARFDPANKTYYQAADILGLLTHNLGNPDMVHRLGKYPPFLALSERQEFEGVRNSESLKAVTGGSANVGQFRAPELNAFVESSPELFDLDLTDLRTYLETGKSPKYDPFKILGVWELDPDQVIVTIRRTRPEITSKQLIALREAVTTMASGTTFKATPDNKATLSVKGAMPDLSKVQAAASAAARPAAVPPAQLQAQAQPRRSLGSMSGMSAAVRERYGRYQQGAPPPGGPPPSPDSGDPAAPPEPPKILTFTFGGSWEGEGNSYKLSLQGEKMPLTKMDATIDGDYLVLIQFGQKLFFVRKD